MFQQIRNLSYFKKANLNGIFLINKFYLAQNNTLENILCNFLFVFISGHMILCYKYLWTSKIRSRYKYSEIIYAVSTILWLWINAVTYLYLQTPVHLAADKGHLHCLSLLLDFGGDCNYLDDEGKSPIDYAHKKRNVLCEHLLLKQLGMIMLCFIYVFIFGVYVRAYL